MSAIVTLKKGEGRTIKAGGHGFFNIIHKKKSSALEAGGFFCVNSAKSFLFLVLKINSCYDKN